MIIISIEVSRSCVIWIEHFLLYPSSSTKKHKLSTFGDNTRIFHQNDRKTAETWFTSRKWTHVKPISMYKRADGHHHILGWQSYLSVQINRQLWLLHRLHAASAWGYIATPLKLIATPLRVIARPIWAAHILPSGPLWSCILIAFLKFLPFEQCYSPTEDPAQSWTYWFF